MKDYYYEKVTGLPFDNAVDSMRILLRGEGFGILAEIDVQKTMREKLGKEISPYVILGACHPPSALAVLEDDPYVGTLLPCNAVAFEDKEGNVHVAAVRPTVLLPSTTFRMEEVAREVEARLKRVVDGI